MVELTVGAHPETFHHGDGTAVRGHRERDDLVQPGLAEAEGERNPRRFGGVPVAPGWKGETPADLHAGREVGLERGHQQADVTDERHNPGNLDRPRAEAALGERGQGALQHEGVRLVAGQR